MGEVCLGWIKIEKKDLLLMENILNLALKQKINICSVIILIISLLITDLIALN
mgnify:CR=1 FL=1